MAQTKVIYKKIIIFTAIFAVLLTYFLVFERKIEKKQAGKNNIFKYVIADVKKFAIEKQDKKIEVERRRNDWIIKEPFELPGSKTDVDSYLNDVSSLQKQKVIGENLTNLSPYGLDKPKIIFKVWISNKLLILKLGNQNPDHSGYYAKFENQPEVLLIEPVAESTIDKELFYFRNKELFSLNVDDLISCEVNFNNKDYLLKYIDDKWVMELPVKFDSPQEIDIKNLIGQIIDINIKKFFDNDMKISVANAGLISPLKIIKMIDKENKVYILNIGKEIKDEFQYYAKMEDIRNLIFAVDKDIIDDVIQDVQKIEEEKKNLEEEKRQEEEEKRKQEEEKEQVKEDDTSSDKEEQ